MNPREKQYGAKKAPGHRHVENAASRIVRDTLTKLMTRFFLPAFKQLRTGSRVVEIVQTMLVMGAERRTISNAIIARGLDQEDFRSDYRAFSEGRWDPKDLFRGVFEAVIPWLPKDGPIVLAIDDTALPKAGHKISYTRWVHNPLCPRWIHPAIQWGLPEFHAAVIIPTREVHRPTAVTVAFEPICKGASKSHGKRRRPGGEAEPPGPRKKGRPTKAEIELRRAAEEADHGAITDVKHGATGVAVEVIKRVRQWMDDMKLHDRILLVVGDGSYTNGSVIGHLPKRTEFLGRAPGSASICELSDRIHGGVPMYGPPLPTPEELASDPSVPDVAGRFDYGGDRRTLRFKVKSPVYRRGSTRRKPLRLLILQPVPFGHGEGRGYNRRAFLLSTDLRTNPEVLVQAYLDRWQIEQLHRDLKGGVGLGQAQVRTQRAVERVHSALVAAYALLVIAVLETQGQERTEAFGRLPRWRVAHRRWWAAKRKKEGKSVPVHRPSVLDMTNLLRRALARRLVA